MKNWYANDWNTRMYHQINKIILKNIIKFYCKAWQYRNEVYFNTDKQKEYLKEWFENIPEKGDLVWKT